MNVAIYIRVGTATQFHEDSQRNHLIEFASRNKLNIFKVYSDVGFGGTAINGPSLKKLIKESNDGKFESVLVSDPSRLSRNMNDLFSLLETWNSKGINVMTPRGEIKCELPFIQG